VQFGHNLELPGVASHFHINKVGSFDLFFGDDSNYVKLPYNDGVEIGTKQRSGPQNVVVDAVDELVPPGGVWRLFIIIEDYPNLGSLVSVGDTVTTSWGASITATVTGVVEAVGDGDWQIQVDQDITAGFDASVAKTVSFGASGGSHTWRFGTDGRLTLPDASPIIRDDGGVSFINFHGAPGGLTLGTSGLDSVAIIVNDDGQGEALKTWEFKNNGSITFPDGTTQYTAYSSIYAYTVSATPPVEANNLWFNIVDGRMYVNIYDEGTLWVDANPPVVAPVSTYLSGLTIDEQTISSVDHASPDVKIAGNLLPDQDLTYDLGSPTNQWNSLHIKDTTIYMSGRALSLTDEGLKVDGGAAISVLDGGVASTWLLPV
jgi:hypothetical protein